MKRGDAKAAGLKRYTGAPCKHGHTERYTCSGSCTVCTGVITRKRMKTRRQQDPVYRDARRKYMAAYRLSEAGLAANRRGANKTRKRHPETVMVRAARRRATELGLPFDITPADVVIPEVCPVLGIPLAAGSGSACDSSPSLDRIVPSLGYVKGNIAVMSFRANALKRDATAEELRKVAAWLDKR